MFQKHYNNKKNLKPYRVWKFSNNAKKSFAERLQEDDLNNQNYLVFFNRITLYWYFSKRIVNREAINKLFSKLSDLIDLKTLIRTSQADK